MITRYSRPEMRAIWTDENKLRIWLQIELLASEALAAEGTVPKADFAKMKVGADQWLADLPGLVARQRELEKTLNHDVIAFTKPSPTKSTTTPAAGSISASRPATLWTPPSPSRWSRARTSSSPT